MSEIKQINTGVAELIIVKVPSDSIVLNVITISDKYWLRYTTEYSEGLRHLCCIELPSSNWEAIGLSNELKEEQCKDIVRSTRYLIPELYWDYVEDKFTSFETAKESFASLMQVNECHAGTWLVLKGL